MNVDKVTMEKVSVIIPTWNRAKMLEKAVQSVLNQSLQPLEILICDDGSTDNSKSIIRKINSSKVIWVENKHCGYPSIIRNKGIQKAKGDWIAFLDSDDIWHPKKLEKQLKLVKKLKCLACSTNARRFLINGKFLGNILNYSNRIISFSDLIEVNSIVLSSAIIYKSLLQKCKGFPDSPKLKNSPDYAFWLRVTTQTDFAYVNETLVDYIDEPKLSVRKHVLNYRALMCNVFGDFLNWSRENKIPFSYRLKALKRYYTHSIKRLINK